MHLRHWFLAHRHRLTSRWALLFSVDGYIIDGGTMWIGLTNVWSLLRGWVSAYFIVVFLSIEEQGLWYTFSNIAALAIVCELGFCHVTSQFISYEYAHLKLIDGCLVGNAHHLNRLLSLARQAIKLFFLAAIVAAFLLAVAGLIYFRDESLPIRLSWVLYSCATGLYLFSTLPPAIYRGLNEVAPAQRATFFGSISLSLIMWVILFYGGGLWALPIAHAAGAILSVTCIALIGKRFWGQLGRHPTGEVYGPKREIVELQTKMIPAVLSNYLTYFLFVPAVYKVEGSVVAGQLGLTLVLVKSVFSISYSIVASKIPRINMLVVSGEREESFKLTAVLTVAHILLFGLGALALFLVVHAFGRYGFFPDRLSSLGVLGLLILTELGRSLITGGSYLLLAHKNPQTSLGIVRGAVIACACFTVLPHFGLVWLLVCVTAVWWLVAVPWTAYELMKCHSAGEE